MLSYSRDSPHLVEPEAAVPFVQHAATCFYAEHNNPVRFLAHSFFDMILNFLFMAIVPEWSLFFRIRQRNSIHISLISHV